MRFTSLLFGAILCSSASFSQTATPKPHKLTPNAVYDISNLSSPLISPEGDWILYSVSKADAQKDKNVSQLYMINKNGTETVSLTEQTKGVGSYQWSPEGKYISFLTAGKEEKEGSQLFLLDRRGGEPIQLTHIKGEIAAYQWFKDGSKILFEIKDPSFADTAKSKVRQPYEIDRYHFKADYEGYLDNRKTHLYTFDVKTKTLDTLTKGANNETDAVVSADGKWVAYASNVSVDFDKNANTDIFLLSLTKDAKPTQLTFYKGTDRRPKFSPDYSKIAFLRSSSEDPFNMYDIQHLGIIDIASKMDKVITKQYDLSIDNIFWSLDLNHIREVVDKLSNLWLVQRSWNWIWNPGAIFDNRTLRRGFLSNLLASSVEFRRYRRCLNRGCPGNQNAQHGKQRRSTKCSPPTSVSSCGKTGCNAAN